MNKFLTVILILLLTGCTTVETRVEEKLVTVYESIDPVTIPVKHPELPDALIIPDVEVYSQTALTIFETLKATVESDSLLSSEEKNSIYEILELVSLLQIEKDPLIGICLDIESGNNLAVYFEKRNATLKSYRKIIDYYREIPAVIVVE